mgnify:CR=1 FL=1
MNYAKIVKLIKKLVKNKHYNFLETLAEDVFDELFKDKRIDKIDDAWSVPEQPGPAIDRGIDPGSRTA